MHTPFLNNSLQLTVEHFNELVASFILSPSTATNLNLKDLNFKSLGQVVSIDQMSMNWSDYLCPAAHVSQIHANNYTHNFFGIDVRKLPVFTQALRPQYINLADLVEILARAWSVAPNELHASLMPSLEVYYSQLYQEQRLPPKVSNPAQAELDTNLYTPPFAFLEESIRQLLAPELASYLSKLEFYYQVKVVKGITLLYRITHQVMQLLAYSQANQFDYALIANPTIELGHHWNQQLEAALFWVENVNQEFGVMALGVNKSAWLAQNQAWVEKLSHSHPDLTNNRQVPAQLLKVLPTFLSQEYLAEKFAVNEQQQVMFSYDAQQNLEMIEIFNGRKWNKWNAFLTEQGEHAYELFSHNQQANADISNVYNLAHNLAHFPNFTLALTEATGELASEAYILNLKAFASRKEQVAKYEEERQRERELHIPTLDETSEAADGVSSFDQDTNLELNSNNATDQAQTSDQTQAPTNAANSASSNLEIDLAVPKETHTAESSTATSAQVGVESDVETNAVAQGETGAGLHSILAANSTTSRPTLKQTEQVLYLQGNRLSSVNLAERAPSAKLSFGNKNKHLKNFSAEQFVFVNINKALSFAKNYASSNGEIFDEEQLADVGQALGDVFLPLDFTNASREREQLAVARQCILHPTNDFILPRILHHHVFLLNRPALNFSTWNEERTAVQGEATVNSFAPDSTLLGSEEVRNLELNVAEGANLSKATSSKEQGDNLYSYLDASTSRTGIIRNGKRSRDLELSSNPASFTALQLRQTGYQYNQLRPLLPALNYLIYQRSHSQYLGKVLARHAEHQWQIEPCEDFHHYSLDDRQVYLPTSYKYLHLNLAQSSRTMVQVFKQILANNQLRDDDYVLVTHSSEQVNGEFWGQVAQIIGASNAQLIPTTPLIVANGYNRRELTALAHQPLVSSWEANRVSYPMLNPRDFLGKSFYYSNPSFENVGYYDVALAAADVQRNLLVAYLNHSNKLTFAEKEQLQHYLLCQQKLGHASPVIKLDQFVFLPDHLWYELIKQQELYLKQRGQSEAAQPRNSAIENQEWSQIEQVLDTIPANQPHLAVDTADYSLVESEALAHPQGNEHILARDVAQGDFDTELTSSELAADLRAQTPPRRVAQAQAQPYTTSAQLDEADTIAAEYRNEQVNFTQLDVAVAEQSEFDNPYEDHYTGSIGNNLVRTAQEVANLLDDHTFVDTPVARKIAAYISKVQAASRTLKSYINPYLVVNIKTNVHGEKGDDKVALEREIARSQGMRIIRAGDPFYCINPTLLQGIYVLLDQIRFHKYLKENFSGTVEIEYNQRHERLTHFLNYQHLYTYPVIYLQSVVRQNLANRRNRQLLDQFWTTLAKYCYTQLVIHPELGKQALLAESATNTDSTSPTTTANSQVEQDHEDNLDTAAYLTEALRHDYQQNPHDPQARRAWHNHLWHNSPEITTEMLQTFEPEYFSKLARLASKCDLGGFVPPKHEPELFNNCLYAPVSAADLERPVGDLDDFATELELATELGFKRVMASQMFVDDLAFTRDQPLNVFAGLSRLYTAFTFMVPFHDRYKLYKSNLKKLQAHAKELGMTLTRDNYDYQYMVARQFSVYHFNNKLTFSTGYGLGKVAIKLLEDYVNHKQATLFASNSELMTKLAAHYQNYSCFKEQVSLVGNMLVVPAYQTLPLQQYAGQLQHIPTTFVINKGFLRSTVKQWQAVDWHLGKLYDLLANHEALGLAVKEYTRPVPREQLLGIGDTNYHTYLTAFARALIPTLNQQTANLANKLGQHRLWLICPELFTSSKLRREVNLAQLARQAGQLEEVTAPTPSTSTPEQVIRSFELDIDSVLEQTQPASPRDFSRNSKAAQVQAAQEQSAGINDLAYSLATESQDNRPDLSRYHLGLNLHDYLQAQYILTSKPAVSLPYQIAQERREQQERQRRQAYLHSIAYGRSNVAEPTIEATSDNLAESNELANLSYAELTNLDLTTSDTEQAVATRNLGVAALQQRAPGRKLSVMNQLPDLIRQQPHAPYVHQWVVPSVQQLLHELDDPQAASEFVLGRGKLFSTTGDKNNYVTSYGSRDATDSSMGRVSRRVPLVQHVPEVTSYRGSNPEAQQQATLQRAANGFAINSEAQAVATGNLAPQEMLGKPHTTADQVYTAVSSSGQTVKAKVTGLNLQGNMRLDLDQQKLKILDNLNLEALGLDTAHTTLADQDKANALGLSKGEDGAYVSLDSDDELQTSASEAGANSSAPAAQEFFGSPAFRDRTVKAKTSFGAELLNSESGKLTPSSLVKESANLTDTRVNLLASERNPDRTASATPSSTWSATRDVPQEAHNLAADNSPASVSTSELNLDTASSTPEFALANSRADAELAALDSPASQSIPTPAEASAQWDLNTSAAIAPASSSPSKPRKRSLFQRLFGIKENEPSADAHHSAPAQDAADAVASTAHAPSTADSNPLDLSAHAAPASWSNGSNNLPPDHQLQQFEEQPHDYIAPADYYGVDDQGKEFSTGDAPTRPTPELTSSGRKDAPFSINRAALNATQALDNYAVESGMHDESEFQPLEGELELEQAYAAQIATTGAASKPSFMPAVALNAPTPTATPAVPTPTKANLSNHALNSRAATTGLGAGDVSLQQYDSYTNLGKDTATTPVPNQRIASNIAVNLPSKGTAHGSNQAILGNTGTTNTGAFASAESLTPSQLLSSVQDHVVYTEQQEQLSRSKLHALANSAQLQAYPTFVQRLDDAGISLQNRNTPQTLAHLKVKILNLDPYFYRWEGLLKLFAQSGVKSVQRIEAINGVQLTPTEMQAHFDVLEFKRHYQRIPTAKEIGKVLSHRKALLSILTDPTIDENDFTLICEDNLEFSAWWQRRLARVLLQAQASNYDWINLTHNQIDAQQLSLVDVGSLITPNLQVSHGLWGNDQVRNSAFVQASNADLYDKLHNLDQGMLTLLSLPHNHAMSHASCYLVRKAAIRRAVQEGHMDHLACHAGDFNRFLGLWSDRIALSVPTIANLHKSSTYSNNLYANLMLGQYIYNFSQRQIFWNNPRY